MTDEEKAEEYLEKHKECTKLKGVYHLTINEKQAYLDGLAEGRKEKCNSCGLRQQKRINLAKENEQLKAQIEQLSNDNHVLKTSFITQQEQIEKMKICSNCKWKSQYRVREHCIECGKVKNKGWELAE